MVNTHDQQFNTLLKETKHSMSVISDLTATVTCPLLVPFDHIFTTHSGCIALLALYNICYGDHYSVMTFSYYKMCFFSLEWTRHPLFAIQTMYMQKWIIIKCQFYVFIM